MTAPIPTNEPLEARAGATWAWTKSLTDYPASAWTLTYYFKQQGASGSYFSVAATASGADYAITVAAATTAGYAAGTWSWVAQVSGGSSEVYEIDRGTLEILPKYTASAALDDRSHARICLDAIEAVMENRATQDQQEYAIEGRSLKRMLIADLLRLRDYYRAQVFAENNAERRRNGYKAGRLVAKL